MNISEILDCETFPTCWQISGVDKDGVSFVLVEIYENFQDAKEALSEVREWADLDKVKIEKVNINEKIP